MLVPLGVVAGGLVVWLLWLTQQTSRALEDNAVEQVMRQEVIDRIERIEAAQQRIRSEQGHRMDQISAKLDRLIEREP